APSPSPSHLRFAAAVASAAVRAAVEGWATAGDVPADGPEGPAELALRNLGVLRDFPWESRRLDDGRSRG
ncbi:TetR family transcriptional regulator, partial [Streptomyces violarus]|nr:TetR family transcriptional regulator [Streptomyces violarus]